MNTSWKNTRDALVKFASVLACHKCGKQPTNAIRHTICGHSFCNLCIESDTVCSICNTAMQPLEVCNDHLINSLVCYCNIAGEIINEKDLWNFVGKSHAMSLVATTNSTFNSNTKLRIPKKNVNKRNAKGETHLHIACVKNQEVLIKALLAAGANPNTKDHSGWTPLQEVVNFGYTNICQLLLECGALPNTPGAGNRSALHDAAINNRLLEAKLLLKYSANKNLYDEHGKKPIDYCEPHSEMWNILQCESKLDGTCDKVVDFNSTLNQSPTLQLYDPVVIYASNLREENKKYLDEVASKHKIKVVPAFQPYVTHIILEANDENVVQLSYDVMIGILHGKWLLNTEWIRFGMDINDVIKGDLEIFEISGAPIKGTPKKARENAQNQKPGLFSHCHFYFALQARCVYNVNGVELTRDSLTTLVQGGSGTILKREPDPENIKNENVIPFHVAHVPTHSLYKCTHFVIYAPGRDEPRIKYNMVHIKTLPLMWLLECIEKFTLVDPSQLGLLEF